MFISDDDMLSATSPTPLLERGYPKFKPLATWFTQLSTFKSLCLNLLQCSMSMGKVLDDFLLEESDEVIIILISEFVLPHFAFVIKYFIGRPIIICTFFPQDLMLLDDE